MVILSNDHQNYILIQHFFEIIIDGVRKWRQENNNPRTFSNVKIWASRGRHGFPPADAYIKQLEYENIGSDSGVFSLLLMLLQSTQPFIFHP